MSTEVTNMFANPFFQLFLSVLNGYFAFSSYRSGSTGWAVFAMIFCVLCFYNFIVYFNKRV